MRQIQTKIPFDSIISRLPSVWPSYSEPMNSLVDLECQEDPSLDGIYYFDDESLKCRRWKYTSNYGMTPMNIILNVKPSVDTEYSGYSITSGCHCYGNEDYSREDAERFYDEFEYSGECNACKDGYETCSGFTMSFDTLSKWYYFFNEYYNLLTHYGHCDRIYTSALDYYNYESNTKYADQMIYGGNIDTYIALDEEFANKGGIVTVEIFNKATSKKEWVTIDTAHDEFIGDGTAIVNVEDKGFFRWICENVVPSFLIPYEYKDYWKRERLYYPDVVKWLAWFEERQLKAYETNAEFKEGDKGEIDTWNCKSEKVEDCCDCEDYFNRGGKKVYDLLKKWYDDVQDNIGKNKKVIEESLECLIPTLILPTTLTINVENLGEMSIFSSEYELGTDYRTARYGDSANTYSGTVVTVSGDSKILSSGACFTYDRYYMEKTYDENAFSSYTDMYIKENREDFCVSSVTFYAFDKDNKVYYTDKTSNTDAISDFKEQMQKIYPLISSENGWIALDGNLYEIKETEYGIYSDATSYLDGKKFSVSRDKDTNTPYTTINGKDIYAEFYGQENMFYFPFFLAADDDEKVMKKYKGFKRNELSKGLKYVDVEGFIFEIEESVSSIEINGSTGLKIAKYAIPEGEYLILSGDSGFIYNNPYYTSVDGAEGGTVNGEDVVKIPNYDDNIITYPFNRIQGVTKSQLYDLRGYNLLTDDIGNVIEGLYYIDKDDKPRRPKQGEEIEPLYQVGNVANLTRFKLTETDENKLGNNARNYFVGDIITKMVFYYKECDDNVPEEVVVTIEATEDGAKITQHPSSSTNASGYTSLSGITMSAKKMDEYISNHSDEVHVFLDDVFCDVTYLIGATLERKKGKKFVVANENNYHKGVEYTEAVRFIKTNTDYYLKKPNDFLNTLPLMRNKPQRHSISYPIYIYKMAQDMTTVENSQYETTYEVALAKFNTLANAYEYDSENFKTKYSSYNDMNKHNNTEVFPTFMEEYRLGSSSMENIKTDIYIDRGINAAFEKHLKLGEVSSLNDLVKYSNGYFKMMEN